MKKVTESSVEHVTAFMVAKYVMEVPDIVRVKAIRDHDSVIREDMNKAMIIKEQFRSIWITREQS